MRKHLQVIDTDDGLPDYPLAADQRLTGHYFIAWHHDRWLASRYRLSAPREMRALAIDLYSLAQRQTPVGTLPDDDVQLAALLMLDLRTWQEARRHEWSPLYKWERCRCGEEVRLCHPVVLEVILDAIDGRDKRLVAGELGRKRKRLDRLPDQILAAGGSRAMAADTDLLERVDAWLMRQCPGNRTGAWVKRALEADAKRDSRY